MDILTPKESCEIEMSRFFKRYYTFTASSDADDLNNLLNSLCSSVEKFEKATGENVSRSNKRYLALKTLRNYVIHHSELLSETKGIKSEDFGDLRADVRILCLVPIAIIQRVIDDTRNDQTKNYIREAFNFYKRYVDIYPAIFNFAVDIYFLAINNSFNISGEDFIKMGCSIQFEKQRGFSHFISGRIIHCHGLPMDEFIDRHAISMDERGKEHESYEDAENGMKRCVIRVDRLNPEQLKKISKADKKFIYDDLVATKAVEIHGGPKNEGFTANRPLLPIEDMIMRTFLNIR
jgi:hypothetical protein